MTHKTKYFALTMLTLQLLAFLAFMIFFDEVVIFGSIFGTEQQLFLSLMTICSSFLRLEIVVVVKLFSISTKRRKKIRSVLSSSNDRSRLPLTAQETSTACSKVGRAKQIFPGFTKLYLYILYIQYSTALSNSILAGVMLNP